MTLNPASQRDESGSKQAHCDADNCTKIIQVMEKLAHIKDVHALLAEVLLQARRLTRADAGSIYLIEILFLISATSITIPCLAPPGSIAIDAEPYPGG